VFPSFETAIDLTLPPGARTELSEALDHSVPGCFEKTCTPIWDPAITVFSEIVTVSPNEANGLDDVNIAV
jgi:hypothetical protein